jgi:hypothetical protein
MNGDVDERVIGFAAREMSLDPARLWDSERRCRYLLRADVRRPLSTDTLVWQGVWEAHGKSDLPVLGTGVQDMWTNLIGLLDCLASAWPTDHRPACWVVAITLLSRLGEVIHQEGRSTDVWPRVTPAHVDPSWLLLGHDVADEGLLSGLSNCGYGPGDFDLGRARTYWIRRLNAFHLFNDRSVAYEFKEFSDARVPEHSPFFVYGLRLVTELSPLITAFRENLDKGWSQ